MKVIVIVQARMGSSRLPGKSMARLSKEKRVQDYLLSSLLEVFNNSDIFYASSINDDNDLIEEWCVKNEVKCYRGDEYNVASRFYHILQESHSDYFFRIAGDSPFYLPELLQTGLKMLKVRPDVDFISSIPLRGYPMGMNIELFNSALFLKEYTKFSELKHFEHVTDYFYNSLSSFKTILLDKLYPEFVYSNQKFSIDTYDDLVRMRTLQNLMLRPHTEYTLFELIDLYHNI